MSKEEEEENLVYLAKFANCRPELTISKRLDLVPSQTTLFDSNVTSVIPVWPCNNNRLKPALRATTSTAKMAEFFGKTIAYSDGKGSNVVEAGESCYREPIGVKHTRYTKCLVVILEKILNGTH